MSQLRRTRTSRFGWHRGQAVAAFALHSPDVRSVAALGLMPFVFAAAAPFDGSPSPTTVPRTLRAQVRLGATIQTISWQTPESFAVRTRGGMPPLGSEVVVERGGMRVLASAPGSRRSDIDIMERRLYAARPDGYSLTQETLLGPTEFVLEQARAGKLRLRLTRVGRRLALRAKVRLYPNDCAALRGGSAELWLDRATLLPVRLRVRRGSLRYGSRTFLRSVNARLAPGAFTAPRSRRQRQVLDYGFVRASPRAAARRLSYRPLLPRVLPPGFSLAVSGWARRSGRTGPEGSNPINRELFGAVYRRGFERIDVTQRLAGGRGWLSDPFGAECRFQLEERAQVSGVRVRFGTGPDSTPHLYWRRGRLLFTVSGPFPKADLVAIAESLAPVTRASR
jgi:hypothetical protein